MKFWFALAGYEEWLENPLKISYNRMGLRGGNGILSLCWNLFATNISNTKWKCDWFVEPSVISKPESVISS